MNVEVEALIKQLVPALVPAIQGMVDAAVAKVPVVGAVLPSLVDAGIAAVEAKNPSYFPSTGIQPVVQDPAASPVAKALGNAQLVPAQPNITASTHEDDDIADLENRMSLLEAKVIAMAAATGVETSAAMAAH